MKDKLLFCLSVLLFTLYFYLNIPIIIVFLYILQNLFMVHIANSILKNKSSELYYILLSFIIIEAISLSYTLTKFYTSLTWGIVFSLILALEPWGLYFYVLKYVKKK